jgi:hypothetical protein
MIYTQYIFTTPIFYNTMSSNTNSVKKFRWIAVAVLQNILLKSANGEPVITNTRIANTDLKLQAGRILFPKKNTTRFLKLQRRFRE